MAQPQPSPPKVVPLRPGPGIGGAPAIAAQAERAILAALLDEGAEALAQLNGLEAKHFGVRANELIFAVVLDLVGQQAKVDAVTVIERLRTLGHLATVGGPLYVANLLDAEPTVGALGDYLKTILDAWALRECEALATKIQLAARLPVSDASAFVARAVERFSTIQEEHGKGDEETEARAGLIADFQALEALAKEGREVYCPTGLPGLDAALEGGWAPGETVIVAARPGTGKTALGVLACLTCARTPYEQGGGGALFVSVELPGPVARQRFLGDLTGLPKGAFKNPRHLGQAGWDTITQATVEVASLPLHIAGRAKRIDTIRATVRRVDRQMRTAKTKLRLVVVDYLQLVAPADADLERAGNREQEVASVSRGLQAMREEFPGVTFVVLAQLNRAVERSKDKRPTMADIRDSGQVEQDADIVIFLWRPEGEDPSRTSLGFGKSRGVQGADVALTVDARSGRVREADQ